HAVLDLPERGHQAGPRLHHEIHTGQERVGAATTERADAANDQSREARRQRRVIEPELLGQPGTKVRQDHVGAREQRVDDRPGARVAQVEGQRAFAAVTREEVARVATRKRRELTHGIALERLDLDDTRAALREQLRAERNRDELTELDDLD